MKTPRTISGSVVLLVAGIGAATGAWLWWGTGDDPAAVPRASAGRTSQSSPAERVETSFKGPVDSPVLPPAELPLPPGAVNVTAPDPVTVSNPPAQPPPPSAR